MSLSWTPNRKMSVKVLGVAMIAAVAAVGGVALVASATGASVGSGGTNSGDRFSMTIVEGATDLSFSGFVDGTVRRVESLDGLSSTQLAHQVIDGLEKIGCKKASSLSGHGIRSGSDAHAMSTTIAEQFDCGGFFAEVGWTTDEAGVDLVVGEPSSALAER